MFVLPRACVYSYDIFIFNGLRMRRSRPYYVASVVGQVDMSNEISDRALGTIESEVRQGESDSMKGGESVIT